MPSTEHYEVCHDCGQLADLEDMEGTSREGKQVLVCVECYVTSGDDAYYAHKRFCKECRNG